MLRGTQYSMPGFACRSRSVRSSSHSESRLRHLISVGVRRRRTAGDVPDQLPRHADKHGTGRSVGLGLRQRLWSEGNAISRSHSRFGTPRRTDSTSRLGPQLFGLKLSELARRPLIGKVNPDPLMTGSQPPSAFRVGFAPILVKIYLQNCHSLLA